MKDSTFIDSPILEILRTIKLNLLPATPFLVYVYGKRLTFGNLLSGNNMRLGILIVSAKSVEVLIELFENFCCNLSVPIPNRQTLDFYL